MAKEIGNILSFKNDGGFRVPSNFSGEVFENDEVFKGKVTDQVKISQKELDYSISIDIGKEFNKNILNIFNNPFVKEYFSKILQDLHKNDETFKKIGQNLGISFEYDTFFDNLKNILFFLDYRFQRLMENEFYKSYSIEIEKEDKSYKNIIEPKIIFIFDSSKISDLIEDLSKNPDIKKELLLFGIAYNEDDIFKYGVKYLIDNKIIKLGKEFIGKIVTDSNSKEIIYRSKKEGDKIINYGEEIVDKLNVIGGYKKDIEEERLIITAYLYFDLNEKKLFNSKYKIGEFGYREENKDIDKDEDFKKIKYKFFEKINFEKDYIIYKLNTIKKDGLNSIYDIKDFLLEKKSKLLNISPENIKLIEETKDEIEALETKKQEIIQELKDLVFSSDRDNKKLNKFFSNFLEKNDFYYFEITKIYHKKIALKKELSSIKDNNKKAKNLKKQIKNLEKELSSIKDNNEIENQKIALEKELSSIKDDNKKAKNLKKQIEDLENQKKDLENKKESLIHQFNQEIINKNQSLSFSINSLRDELTQINKKISDLNSKIFNIETEHQSKLEKNNQIIKDTSYLLTIFRKFETKFGFLLYGKDPTKGLYPDAGNIYPLLTRILEQIKEKTDGLGNNFGDKLFYSFSKGEINVDEFKVAIENEFNIFKNSRIEKISSDIEKNSVLKYEIINKVN